MQATVRISSAVFGDGNHKYAADMMRLLQSAAMAFTMQSLPVGPVPLCMLRLCHTALHVLPKCAVVAHLLLKVTVAEQGACLDVQRAIPDGGNDVSSEYAQPRAQSLWLQALECS